jgi:hypothetical protein
MGLDTGRLLISTALKLSFAKTLDQGQRLALKTTVEASASTAVNEVDELSNCKKRKETRKTIPAQWA